MGFGYGGSDRAPETARTVAKAFYTGKPRKRGNCCTDGERYILVNSVIARRIDVPLRVAYALENDGKVMPPGHDLSFSFGGWPTKMTARHLCALGIQAYCQGIKKPIVTMNGKTVHPSQWYTIAELEAIVEPVSEPKKPRTQFVNLTMELFPS